MPRFLSGPTRRSERRTPPALGGRSGRCWLIFCVAIQIGGSAIVGGASAVESPGVIRSSGLTHSADTLKGRALGISDRLALPTNLLSLGSDLIVQDSRSAFPFHAVRLEPDGGVSSFGVRGRGPGEVRAISFLARSSSDESTFWAYDILSRTLVQGTVSGPPRILSDETIRLSSDGGPAFELTPWGRGWVGHGLFSDGRFGFFSPGGDIIEHAGDLPPGDPADPAYVSQQAYQSTFDVRPDSMLLVTATKHADLLEIWDAKGTRLALAERPVGFEPQYTTAMRNGHPVMASDGSMRFGYLRVRCTQDRIYALYSGFTREERPGAAHLGSVIRVFSWSGQLLSEHRVDFPLMTIEVDVERQLLFGARHSPTPEIMEYRLP